jgi:hypothetical protein
MANDDNGPRAKADRSGLPGWFQELDRLLRGELTGVSNLQAGGIEISPRRLSGCIIILAMVYGACMGAFALFQMGSELRLMPSVNVSDIPSEGKRLVVVAAVDQVLHFRIFDGAGKMIVDLDATRLTKHERAIEDLRKQLERLWPPHELTQSEKFRVIAAVTSIVGHPIPMNGPNGLQVVASMVKVPLLFYLTLLVTLPSLYVFNALVGSRLSLSTVIRLLVASLGVIVTVLASLGPIVAFFSVSTTSYPFMVLFNVLVFAVSGVLGLTFLLQTLHRLNVAETRRPQPDAIVRETSEPGGSAEGVEPAGPREVIGPLEPLENRVLSGHVKTVFRLWVIVFGLVGAQMGWVLRPFIGNPNMPFTFFRGRESNFFMAVLQKLGELFSS